MPPPLTLWSTLLKHIMLIALTLYTLFTRTKVAIQRHIQNLHRYKLVYLELDDEKHEVHVIIDGERVQLNLQRAQPLKGIRVGNQYFTSKKDESFVQVHDEDF